MSSATVTGCRSATPATGASSSATRTHCRNPRSAATTTRRTATTTCSPSTTTSRSTRARCGTRACPGIASTSRTTRSTATSIRSCPSRAPYQVTGPPFPQINIDGYEGMFPRTFRQPKNDAYSVNSNISKSMGRHFLKVGGEFRPTSSTGRTRSIRTARSASTTTSRGAIR